MNVTDYKKHAIIISLMMDSRLIYHILCPRCHVSRGVRSNFAISVRGYSLSIYGICYRCLTESAKNEETRNEYIRNVELVYLKQCELQI